MPYMFVNTEINKHDWMTFEHTKQGLIYAVFYLQPINETNL